ncbi:unnamed protein product [Ectocarpus sp. 13 AM-2016]
MHDRSAAHQAAQWTCARLDAVRRMVDASTSMWKEDQAACQLKEAEARDRELDETQTPADSCAADFEDISSRSVDLVRTLQEDAANTAVHVGGLNPEAEDRDGSDNDSRKVGSALLEAVQRLALTAASTLEEEIFTCQGEKADAVDREGKTDENMRKLNGRPLRLYQLREHPISGLGVVLRRPHQRRQCSSGHLFFR